MARDLHKPTLEGSLKKLLQRVEALERHARMGTSSIRNGALQIQDASGAVRVRLGLLPDSTYGLQIISTVGDGVNLNNDIIGATYNPKIGEAQEAGDRTVATYGDLSGGATVGPAMTVPISARGQVLVVCGAKATHFNTLSTDSRLTFEASGANTLAAADSRAAGVLVSVPGASTIAATVASVRLLLGFNPGMTTFTMRYRGDGTTLSRFTERFIFAIPL